MDFATIGGVVMGIILLLGAILGGGSLGAFIDIPSIMVTLGGTIAAILIAYPIEKVKTIVAVTMKLIKAGQLDPTPWYSKVLEIAQIARRDGLLALEDQIPGIEDPFLQRGLQMALDGTPPEAVEQIMELEIENLESRHEIGHSLWKDMGTFSPAMGMVGTLIGLVNMLQNLDDPSKIGAGMAVALLTTLYGAIFANMFCIPFQTKLEKRTAEEVLLKRMLLTAIISIQAGDSPRVVGEKLMVYIKPAQRDDLEAS